MDEDTENVIDLWQWNNSKIEPEPHLVSIDEDGRNIYTFGCEFQHSDGSRYAFNILAYDFDDANAKMESIRQSAKVVGKIYAEIPA